MGRFLFQNPFLPPAFFTLSMADGFDTHSGKVFMMKKLRCWAAIGLGLAIGWSASAASAEDQKLDSYFKKYLDAWFTLRPVDGTTLGDRRFDAQMDDFSPAALARWPQLNRETLAGLAQAVNTNQLSADAKLDYEIFRHAMQQAIWAAENTRPYEQDPRLYNVYISDSVFAILAQSSWPKETAIAKSIERMRQLPRVTEAARRLLKDPPRVIVETAIRQNQGSIGFYENDLFELAGETPQKEALKKAAQEVVANLKEYQKFLEQDLLPKANGEWRLGKEKFAQKLDMELDAGMSAEEILGVAESEFARVERDMYVIARQLWSRYYPQQALPPDDAAGRTATVRQVLAAIGKVHCTPAELTAEVKADVAKVKAFIAERDILRLPDPDRCQIIEMPEFQRGNSTAYMNASPPLDPEAPGFYAVSPPPKDWDAQKVESYLQEYNRQMLHILTIHEGYPGHYVQLEYANRNPSLIRRVLQSGVYIEGWAVYTEQTMLDQGYGDQDLALRLSQLKFYLRAVANTILDHKMHCTDMTDDQAMDLLVNRSFQSEGEARLKVIRAKQSSCQLSTYFAGRTAMYRLRTQISREMGDRFVLGRFHEAVLAPGAVPVKYLPELVRAKLKAP